VALVAAAGAGLRRRRRWSASSPALVCVVAGDDLALLEEQRREEAREGALRAEIARLTRELGGRRIACAPPPATEPPPRRAEAAPETTPTPDPPRVEPPNRDVERAREQGGRTGQVQIGLAWEDENDLDLEVICPNGQRIRYDRRRACGGELDIDRNAAPPLTRRAVENIVFDGPPAPGRYRIVVTNFANNPPARPVSPFRVTVRIEGQPDRVYTGQLAPRGVSEVGAFEIPPR
jgi:hypothetical protein